jgi:hypothetical protein
MEPSKIRLNAFYKSELNAFASCVEFDVQFIQIPVGINFETKEATYLQLETIRNSYNTKHKANINRDTELKKLAK